MLYFKYRETAVRINSVPVVPTLPFDSKQPPISNFQNKLAISQLIYYPC